MNNSQRGRVVEFLIEHKKFRSVEESQHNVWDKWRKGFMPRSHHVIDISIWKDEPEKIVHIVSDKENKDYGAVIGFTGSYSFDSFYIVGGTNRLTDFIDDRLVYLKKYC